MPSLTVKWRSMHDANVCPICKELDATAEWTFSGAEGVPDQLEWGGIIVWDKLHGSDAHGSHHSGNPKCRCRLEGELNTDDIKQRLEQILATQKAARGIT